MPEGGPGAKTRLLKELQHLKFVQRACNAKTEEECKKSSCVFVEAKNASNTRSGRRSYCRQSGKKGKKPVRRSIQKKTTTPKKRPTTPSNKHLPQTIPNPSSTRNSSPIRNSSPTRNSSPARNSNSTRNSSPIRNSSPTRNSSPARNSSSTRNSSPARNSSSGKNSSPSYSQRGRIIESKKSLLRFKASLTYVESVGVGSYNEVHKYKSQDGELLVVRENLMGDTSDEELNLTRYCSDNGIGPKLIRVFQWDTADTEWRRTKAQLKTTSARFKQIENIPPPPNFDKDDVLLELTEPRSVNKIRVGNVLFTKIKRRTILVIEAFHHDLSDFLGQRGKSVVSVSTLAPNIIESIDIAADHKLMHGDLKAKNMLLSRDGTSVVMTDFDDTFCELLNDERDALVWSMRLLLLLDLQCQYNDNPEFPQAAQLIAELIPYLTSRPDSVPSHQGERMVQMVIRFIQMHASDKGCLPPQLLHYSYIRWEMIERFARTGQTGENTNSQRQGRST